jgi:hypothetical protein
MRAPVAGEGEQPIAPRCYQYRRFRHGLPPSFPHGRYGEWRVRRFYLASVRHCLSARREVVRICFVGPRFFLAPSEEAADRQNRSAPRLLRVRGASTADLQDTSEIGTAHHSQMVGMKHEEKREKPNCSDKLSLKSSNFPQKGSRFDENVENEEL